jgi:hypothetical protein
MSGPQLLELLGELLVPQNRIAALATRTVRGVRADPGPGTRRADDGAVVLRGRLSPAAASRIVHPGRALEHLPAVAEAFAAGLALAAATQPFDTVRGVRRYVSALVPDGPEPGPTEGRRLSLVKHADGGPLAGLRRRDPPDGRWRTYRPDDTGIIGPRI